MRNMLLSGAVMGIVIFLSSCVTTHPNEKLLIGEWKPVKSEKCFTEAEEAQFQKAVASGSTTAQKSPKKEEKPAGSPTENPGGSTGEVKDLQTQLNRAIQVESRTPIVINPDKTAVKFYQARTVKATWKLRKKGTVIIAKDLVKKDKYRIDIQEIGENQLVLVEHMPIGGIKVTYTKVTNPEGGNLP